MSKTFGSNSVLRSISLEVQAGEVLCVVGPSGSGKSTFRRCINHREKIDAGRLLVEGHWWATGKRAAKLHDLRPKEAAPQRRDIAMVFQRFNLFPHMTVLENIIQTG